MLNHTDIATKQLDRILGFFSRVEAKASFLFAVNAALLGSIPLNLRFEDLSRLHICLPATASILLVGASLWFVYRCTFPNLKGGAGSLIYFREVAARTEASYIEEFLKLDENKYVRELLGQVWRNSEILSAKFHDLKCAFTLTALALLPWFWFMVAAALIQSQTPSIQ